MDAPHAVQRCLRRPATHLLLVLLCSAFVIPSHRASGQTLIVYGQTLKDSVSSSGEVRHYEFAGQAGDKIVVRVNRTSGSVRPFVQIMKPDGSNGMTQGPLSDGSTYYRAWIDSYELPSAGMYSLLISDSNGARTGAYIFTLQRSNPPPGQVTIAYGDTRRDTISLQTQIRVLQFTGTAGDKITIRLNRTSGNFNPLVQIFSPDGGSDTTQRPFSDAGAYFRTWLDSLKLSSSGTYTIFISDDNGQETGRCILTLQRMNAPAGPVTIAIGDTRRDTLSLQTQIRVYQFTGAAGDNIVIRVNRATGSFNPLLQIFKPDGSVGTSQDPFSDGSTYYRAWIDGYKLPLNGTYSVFVSDDNGQETGGYVLTLQRSNSPLHPVAIAYGDTQMDTVSIATPIRILQFTGVAGDKIFVRVNRTSGSVNPLLQIFAPDGSSGARQEPLPDGSGYYRAWVDSYELLAGGAYTIFVSDDNGRETGGYILTLQRSNMPARARQLTKFDTTTQRITLPTQIRCSLFSGSAGDTVTIKAQRDSATLSPILEVFNPDGRLWIRQFPFLDAGDHKRTWIVDSVLKATGVFAIFVSDDNGVKTGRYGFTFSLRSGKGVGVPPSGTMEPLPAEYALLQNYPNPFNPSTVLEYHIPRAAHVNLTIYDIIGREVSRPVDGSVNAGRYRIMIDGSKLATGVYLCVMRSGDFVGMIRILLIK